MISDAEIADDLISGKLKRARSYSSDYGGKTYGAIKELAQQGDPKSKRMKKLIEQNPRLSQKAPKRR